MDTDDFLTDLRNPELEIEPQDGHEGWLVQMLADMTSEQAIKWISERAERGRLINFIWSKMGWCHLSDLDELSGCALRIVRDGERRAAWLASYPGMKAEYDSLRYRLRKAMIARGDKQVCVYCGSTDHISIDHITPLMRGGTNDLSNLQFLCRSCNSRKKDHIQMIPSR